MRRAAGRMGKIRRHRGGLPGWCLWHDGWDLPKAGVGAQPGGKGSVPGMPGESRGSETVVGGGPRLSSALGLGHSRATWHSLSMRQAGSRQPWAHPLHTGSEPGCTGQGHICPVHVLSHSSSPVAPGLLACSLPSRAASRGPSTRPCAREPRSKLQARLPPSAPTRHLPSGPATASPVSRAGGSLQPLAFPRGPGGCRAAWGWAQRNLQR